MKFLLKKIAIIFALSGLCLGAQAAEKLLIAGCNWDKIMVIDKKNGRQRLDV